MLIPEGFAHGFSVLSEYATIQYKCNEYYRPESESGVRFDDPDLQIDGKVDPGSVIISERDRKRPFLKQL